MSLTVTYCHCKLCNYVKNIQTPMKVITQQRGREAKFEDKRLRKQKVVNTHVSKLTYAVRLINHALQALQYEECVTHQSNISGSCSSAHV